jgi:hypothetical protein
MKLYVEPGETVDRLSCLVSGPIFDAHGLKWLLIPGCIGLSVLLGWHSLSVLAGTLSRHNENELDADETCTEYYQFFLYFGILGCFAISTIWTTSIATTGHCFFNNRGIATDVETSAGPFGGIILPIMFKKLEPRLAFRWTFRILGFISLAMGGLAIVLMKTRLLSSRTIK